MVFFESGSLIGSQMLSNWLIGNNVEKNILSPSMAAVLIAIVGIIYIAKGWTEIPQTTTFNEYKMSCYAYIFGGNIPVLFIQISSHFLLHKLNCLNATCMIFN